MSEPKTFPVYDDSGSIGVVLAPARFLDARSEKTIRLNNGQEITVPSAALKVQQDGSFRLLRTSGQNDPAARAENSVPATPNPPQATAQAGGSSPAPASAVAAAGSAPQAAASSPAPSPGPSSPPPSSAATSSAATSSAPSSPTQSTASASSAAHPATPASSPTPPIPGGTFLQDDYDFERVPIGRIIEAPMTQRHEGETLVLPVVEEVLVYQKKLYLREEIRITRRRKPVQEVRKIEQQPPQTQR